MPGKSGMTIKMSMKIIISEDARKALTSDEYKYLLLLELHEEFWKAINEMRAKLNLPPYKNEEVSVFTLSDSYDISKVAEDIEIRRSTIEIIEKLNLPVTLYFAIKSVLQYGHIDFVDDSITVHYLDSYLTGRTRHERLFLDLEFPYAISYPTITIKKRLTKEQLFREIGDRWFKVEEFMKSLETSKPTVTVTKISVKDIEESIEIYKFRGNGTSYKEIRNKFHLEEATLRQKYSQIKKLLKKLKFVKK